MRFVRRWLAFFSCIALLLLTIRLVAGEVPGRIVMVGASATAGFTFSEPLGGKKTEQFVLSHYLDAAITMPHEPVHNLGNAMFFMQPLSVGAYQIQQALKDKPNLLVGIDFLFWYCYGRGCADAERLQRFETGLKLLETVKCPLILGDIADAARATNILTADEVPASQIVDAANRRLKEWAANRPQVTIVPLADFVRNALANQPLTVHGQTIPAGKTRALLQWDRLHPSARGCAVLAISILDAFPAPEREAMGTNVCWDPGEILKRVAHNSN